MKATDIAKLPAGTCLAVSGAGRRDKLGARWLNRAILLDPAPGQQPRGRYDYRQPKPAFRLAVEKNVTEWDDEGATLIYEGTEWEPRWAPSTEILGTWTDHETASKARLAAEDAENERRNAAAARSEQWEADTVAALIAAGFKTRDYGTYVYVKDADINADRRQVTFTGEGLDKVLAALTSNVRAATPSRSSTST